MRIPIVNERDEIIGYKDRRDRNLVDITRVAALWITDREGNILLAQRSLTKDINPGLWGPAVAGTVEEGETYESNIIKEAEEEIGLKNIIPIIGPKLLRESTHKYFGQWFMLVIDRNTKITKQDSEVEELRWFSAGELNDLLKNKPEIFLKDFNKSVELFKDENKN